MARKKGFRGGGGARGLERGERAIERATRRSAKSVDKRTRQDAGIYAAEKGR